jgi:hypothetical protein
MSGKIINKNLELYKEFKIQRGLEILEKNIVISEIKSAAKFHLENSLSTKFQDYYREILKNEKLLLNSEKYFSIFKSRYSLQGIDSAYLNYLEKSKSNILKLIKDEEFISLYETIFSNRKLGEKINL